MALWSVAFQGTTPIGGPLIGVLIDHTNPRMGLVVGAASCLVAALGGTVAVALRRPADATAPHLRPGALFARVRSFAPLAAKPPGQDARRR
jgi:hypothetical protein